MKSALLLLTALLPAILAADETPIAQVFQINCSACHRVDQMTVGPSLIEIAGIYRENPDGFLKWCIKPEPKRPGVIEMPSMAHLGEPTLLKLREYIIQAAKGKTELKKSGGDPFGVPVAYLRRPQVQRMFLSGASPAAIAVALPGDLSYCFDAGECRLRYVWKGGFIDGWPYWKSNGSSQANIDGAKTYTEERFPLMLPKGAIRSGHKFFGYTIAKDGLPTFRYQQHGHEWMETIKPLASGNGVERHFESKGGEAITVIAPEGVEVTSSTGSLEITADQSKSFSLTFRWK